MSDSIIKTVFNDQDITTFLYNGQPTWKADEVAKVLGYSETKKLTRKLTNEWKDNFREKTDLITLKGRDLSDFNKLQKEVPGSGPSYANTITLLTKSGVQMVCMLARTKIATEFRFHLVDYVFPQIELGLVKLKSKEEVEAAKKKAIEDTKYQMMLRKLDVEEKKHISTIEKEQARKVKIELDRSKFRYKAMKDFEKHIKSIPGISQEAIAAFRVSMLEESGAIPPEIVRPMYNIRIDITATDIHNKIIKDTGYDISPQKVGLFAAKLGFQKEECEHSICRVGKTKDNRTVPWWHYDQYAADTIIDAIYRSKEFKRHEKKQGTQTTFDNILRLPEKKKDK